MSTAAHILWPQAPAGSASVAHLYNKCHLLNRRVQTHHDGVIRALSSSPLPAAGTYRLCRPLHGTSQWLGAGLAELEVQCLTAAEHRRQNCHSLQAANPSRLLAWVL